MNPLSADPREWPPSVPLWPSLGLVMPIGRAKCYAMAQAGELPFVSTLGSRRLIITARLLNYLGLADSGAALPGTASATVPPLPSPKPEHFDHACPA